MQNFPEKYMFLKPVTIVGKSIPGNNSSFTGKSLDNNPEDFDLQFLPESGRYLSGKPAKIAFKAIGTDGLSEEVNIKLYNTKDSLIGEYKTVHKGMGFISLYNVDTSGYKAVATTTYGYIKKFSLPKPSIQGAMITLNNSGEKIIVKTYISKEIDSCSLIIRNGSEVLYSVPVKDETINLFYTKSLAAGVISAEIHSVSGDILAERLFYVKDNSIPILTMNCNKSKYYTRDCVELTYSLKDSTGNPLIGEFSISVIDKSLNTNKFDKVSIVEYYNLVSELNGYVEDPEYYFNDLDKNRERNLDILMMTQGWRFHTYGTNSFTREYGQTISGFTSGLLNKKSKNSNLMLFAPAINLLQAYQLNKQNNFIIENLDFPEGTKFLFGTSGKHGGQLYGIHINKEMFPEIKEEYITSIMGKRDEDIQISLISKGVISPADMEIQIEGLVVEAQAKERYKPKYNPSPLMHTFTRHQIREREELADFDEMPLTSYICSTFPNLYKNNGVIASGRATNFDGPQQPQLYVDGLRWNSTKLLDDYGYLVMDIENVAFLKGLEGSAFNTTDGVILITTRRGEGGVNYKASNVVDFTPLGYQKETQFYSPKYDTPESLKTPYKDFRNTIFWAPFVKTDNDGLAKIIFYTNDRSRGFLISAQGLTIDGRPINFDGEIRVSGISNPASKQP